MEISEDHVEYAVVHRLMTMLAEPRASYEVTETFAHFTAILCWTTQRMRSGSTDVSAAADAARTVWSALKKETISMAPWSITIATPKTTAIVHSYADVGFEGHTADRLVKNLRDAVAHGDARKIHPLHSPGKSPHRKLTGFQFDCEERNGSKVKWNGRIRLTAPDMRRIGIEIAHRFCKELQKSSGYSYLGEDSAEGVSEAA